MYFSRDCSAAAAAAAAYNNYVMTAELCRDTRRCLVVRYANRVFGVVFKLGNNQRRQLGIYTSFSPILNSPPPEFY